MLATYRTVKSMVAVAAALVGLAACSSDDSSSPGPSGYPREVGVEYKVTSSNVKNVDIIYVNESGANTSLSNVALPFSKSIRRTVNVYDHVTLTIGTSEPGAVTTELWVDGNKVDSKVHEGTDGPHGSSIYLFQ